MIRVYKYSRVAVLVIVTLLFTLQRWRSPSSCTRNVAYMFFIGLCAVWMLLYGLEGVADRKKIKGKLTDRQRTVYYIAVGQLIGGIMGLLFLVYSFWHLDEFLRNP